MIVVTGDLNAEVGSNNINREEVTGKFGVGVMNDNGRRLCDLCGTNGLSVTGTFFPHKEILDLPGSHQMRKLLTRSTMFW